MESQSVNSVNIYSSTIEQTTLAEEDWLKAPEQVSFPTVSWAGFVNCLLVFDHIQLHPDCND